MIVFFSTGTKVTKRQLGFQNTVVSLRNYITGRRDRRGCAES